MKELNERQQQGVGILGEMLGPKAAEAVTARVQAGGVGTDLTAMALENVFSGIWGRPGLDRRSRSLVTIGVLMAARAEAELRNHFRIALRHGLTPAELEEAVMQAHPYTGFSATGPAMESLVHVLREAGLDGGAKTSAEQGLL